MSLNQCQFIGNLGRDPEVRTTQNGDKIANLRLAVSETWKDKQTGERKEKTEWVSVVIWGPLAGIAEQYLRKGSKVYISGKMETRKWQDQLGADRYSTEVVLRGFDAKMEMLDGPRDRGGEDHPPQGRNEPRQDGYAAGGRALDEDPIPF